MDNINYIIKENSQKNNEFDISVYQNELDQNELDQNELDQTDLDYNYSVEELYILYTSYSVRSLVQILEFYNINKYNINNKKKLVKDEIIQLLVLFEQDTSNKFLVKKRRRLWNSIDELKNDAYFKNFIMFTI
jgi:hypothetical protein